MSADSSTQAALPPAPQDANDPALKTWANLTAAKFGGGHMWIPGSYDPETHLYIVGTGNPTPAYTSKSRGDGDNLYTCTLVAINVDTGKLAWYYDHAPGETLDLDEVFERVLVDDQGQSYVFSAGKPGILWKLDRKTGKHLAHKEIGKAAAPVDRAIQPQIAADDQREPQRKHQ